MRAKPTGHKVSHMAVQRYDKITLDRSKVLRLDNGMMRVPARLSRIGIQDYRRADGTIERAYRPEDEVSKSAPLFDHVPVVDDHPTENNAVVDASNYKRLSVGLVLNPVYKDGFVECELLIQDATAVAKVEAGKVEMSAGYFIDREEKPGITADGQSYDFIQRNINPNHAAIVDHGRAGHDVRILLDQASVQDVAHSVDFAPTAAPNPLPKVVTMKITLDGEREVEETLGNAITKEREAAAQALAEVKAALEKKTAQCDALDTKVKALETELAAAPEKARASILARADLEAKAKTVAPEVKCDGLDDMGVKRAVCVAQGIKLDGKEDVYVSARFDILVEDAGKKNPATEAAGKELTEGKTPEVDGVETPAQARAKAEAEFFKQK